MTSHGITANIEMLENLREDWTSLLPGASLNNLFLTWEWIHSWRCTMMDQSEIPFIVTAREDKRLIGLAPMVLVRHRILGNHLQFIGQSHSYHLGFIARKGSEERVYGALWDYMLDNGTIRCQTIEFLHMEEDAIFESVLKRQADKRGLILKRSIQNTCKVIDLPGSYDAYLKSGISSYKLRRDLRRYFRRLKKECTVDFRNVDSVDFPKYWVELLNLHRQQMLSKGARSVLMDTSFPYHLQQVAEAFQEKQTLRLAILILNHETAAIILGIIYNRVFYALTMGLNPCIIHTHPWLNVCVLSNTLCIKTAIENGCKQYDFLGGHHDYKYRMGGRDRAGIRIKIYRSKKDKLKERGLLCLKSFLDTVLSSKRRIHQHVEKEFRRTIIPFFLGSKTS
jgi:CelD/BcsL family acetyltransferase involved in cellulose biosynthesis